MLNNQGHDRGHDQGSNRNFGSQFNNPQGQGGFPLGGVLSLRMGFMATPILQKPREILYYSNSRSLQFHSNLARSYVQTLHMHAHHRPGTQLRWITQSENPVTFT